MRVARLVWIVLCFGILPTVSGCAIAPAPYEHRPASWQGEAEHEAWARRRWREHEREREEALEQERSHHYYEGAP